MENLTCTVISFDTKERQISFKIYHNLPNISGLSLHNAVTNWSVRTNLYTAESLVKYVRSKNTGYLIYTEEEYKNLKNEKD